jgi:hypothetical protein
MLSDRPMFTIHAQLAPIVSLGATPSGERRIVNITGGTVYGPKLNGRILPGGADWQIIRQDGVAAIEARYTIESDEGARILVFSDGLRHGPAAIIAQLARGEAADPSAYYFRTAMRFETAAPALIWLNKVIGLARGARDPDAVRLEVFEVL